MLVAALFGLSSSLVVARASQYITCGRQSINGDDVRVSGCHFSNLASVGNNSASPYSDEGNGNGGAIFIQQSSAPGSGGSYFRVYVRDSLFERCRARLRGGAVYLVAQAEDVNTSTFLNCSADVGGTGFIQATASVVTPAVGHIQLNTVTVVNSRATNHSNLLLLGWIGYPFPRYGRNSSVVVSVLNSTAPGVNAHGGGITLDRALKIDIQFARFVRLARGFNVLSLGPSQEGTASTLSCLLFLNNSLSASQGGIRGIIYASYSYTVTDALFWGNNVPENVYAVAAGAAVRLTLTHCLIDAGAAVTGNVVTINCTAYHGSLPANCHFAEATAAPSQTRTPAATKKGDKSGGGTAKGKKLSKGAIAGIVIAVIVVVAAIVIGLLIALGRLCKKGGANKEGAPAAPHPGHGGSRADEPLADEPPPEEGYTNAPPPAPT